MYIRCAGCHNATRLGRDQPGPVVFCESCVRKRAQNQIDEPGPTAFPLDREAPQAESRRAPGATILGVLLAGFLIWGFAARPAGTTESHDAYLAEMPRRQPTVSPPVVEATLAVRVDPHGHVTEIKGATPQAVLSAYCERSTPRCEPVRITPSQGAWTAVFTRRGVLDEFSIRRDESGGGWIAGDGVERIPRSSNR